MRSLTLFSHRLVASLLPFFHASLRVLYTLHIFLTHPLAPMRMLYHLYAPFGFYTHSLSSLPTLLSTVCIISHHSPFLFPLYTHSIHLYSPPLRTQSHHFTHLILLPLPWSSTLRPQRVVVMLFLLHAYAALSSNFSLMLLMKIDSFRSFMFFTWVYH